VRWQSGEDNGLSKFVIFSERVKADYPAKHQNKNRKKAMSTIIKLVATAERLFQPADDKKSFAANPEIKFPEPTVICQPGQRFWKLSARAASRKFAIIEISILVLFLALALVGMVSCFAELSHLLHSDAVGRVAARAINGSV
jgi:hypothetical protein